MIKNVCAPAVVLGEKIVIVGGELTEDGCRGQTWQLLGEMVAGADRETLFYGQVFFKTQSLGKIWKTGQGYPSGSFSMPLCINKG